MNAHYKIDNGKYAPEIMYTSNFFITGLIDFISLNH